MDFDDFFAAELYIGLAALRVGSRSEIQKHRRQERVKFHAKFPALNPCGDSKGYKHQNYRLVENPADIRIVCLYFVCTSEYTGPPNKLGLDLTDRRKRTKFEKADLDADEFIVDATTRHRSAYLFFLAIAVPNQTTIFPAGSPPTRFPVRADHIRNSRSRRPNLRL